MVMYISYYQNARFGSNECKLTKLFDKTTFKKLVIKLDHQSLTALITDNVSPVHV